MPRYLPALARVASNGTGFVFLLSGRVWSGGNDITACPPSSVFPFPSRLRTDTNKFCCATAHRVAGCKRKICASGPQNIDLDSDMFPPTTFPSFAISAFNATDFRMLSSIDWSMALNGFLLSPSSSSSSSSDSSSTPWSSWIANMRSPLRSASPPPPPPAAAASPFFLAFRCSLFDVGRVAWRISEEAPSDRLRSRRERLGLFSDLRGPTAVSDMYKRRGVALPSSCAGRFGCGCESFRAAAESFRALSPMANLPSIFCSRIILSLPTTSVSSSSSSGIGAFRHSKQTGCRRGEDMYNRTAEPRLGCAFESLRL
mmetsp:Transcript_363/g.514  ORF Transcript_363/g.514 Transcript_363/m.514 type:complete len:314 (+) Transcript_363:91-1032(+)